MTDKVDAAKVALLKGWLEGTQKLTTALAFDREMARLALAYIEQLEKEDKRLRDLRSAWEDGSELHRQLMAAVDENTELRERLGLNDPWEKLDE